MVQSRSTVGLGISRYTMPLEPTQQEGLACYDQQGNRYLTAEERSQQEQQRAERLAQRLRELGEVPDQILEH